MKNIEVVTIDGEQYTLNAESALEYGWLKKVFVPKHVGQFFRNSENFRKDDNVYLLCRSSGNEVTLIQVADKGFDLGNRWREPVRVKDDMKISEREWEAISGTTNIFTDIPAPTITFK